MAQAADIAGQRFGRLVALNLAPTLKPGRIWRCVCDCGAVVMTTVGRLRAGNTKSCGCLQKAKAREARLRGARHNMSATPTYNSWKSMVARCTNPLATDFHLYGGRGVGICAEWLRFDGFFADMGNRPEGKTLDRINPSGNYEAENCRWATPAEQAANKRTNLLVTYQGETACVSEWARRLGFGKGMLKNRIRAGWSVEQALTKPARKTRRKEQQCSI